MKQMSELEIAAKLRAGKTFTVRTTQERQKVLDGAKFIGAQVTTRAIDGGGFNVFFLSAVATK
jgi:hypothetical protein